MFVIKNLYRLTFSLNFEEQSNIMLYIHEKCWFNEKT